MVYHFFVIRFNGYLKKSKNYIENDFLTLLREKNSFYNIFSFADGAWLGS